MKRAMFLFCGICWLIFGLAMGVFWLGYIADGAGLQDYAFGFPILSPAVSSGSVLVGLAHVLGLFMLSVLCLVIGLGLCLHGFESRRFQRRHEQL